GNPLQGITVAAHERFIIDSVLDADTSDTKGSFRLRFSKFAFKPRVYLVIADNKKNFIRVQDVQGDYEKVTHDIDGDTVWRGKVMNSPDDVGHIEITITLRLRDSPEKYESVVIGSGFGGTILSLTVANSFSKSNAKKDNAVQLDVPSFNPLPGEGKRQNLLITYDGPKPKTTLKIASISFKEHSEWFKLEPGFPLTIELAQHEKKQIPLTVTIPKNNPPINEDLEVELVA